MSRSESSYLALRAVSAGGTDAWWAAVRRTEDVPTPVAALVAGRTRVELSADEASAALAWAATVHGWAEAEPKPLLVHRAGD